MKIPALSSLTQKLRTSKGFTLIELLVVIGILAVLLAIVLIAINPARQFAQANNTQRSSDVNSILNAVHQYMADNSGTPPAGIPTGTALEISSATAANICAALVPVYIAALPVDPGSSATPVTDCAAVGGYATGYTIVRSATDSRITVAAPGTELGGTPITVSR